jgi:uncharacterized protein YrrD/ElaB/YqjD/DUF883 family membrane-anchored ribosome-binding protein
MSELPQSPMRRSEISDRLVIDVETTETLGQVSQLLVDLKNHQIEGLVCKSGFLGTEKIPVPWVQLESIGGDSIVVRQGREGISPRFDQALPLGGQELWTDGGDRVGQLVDYCFDPTTGAITQYLFTAPGWQGLTAGVYSFGPEAVISAGRKRLMVQQAALKNAPQYEPGLPDRAAEVFQQDVDQTRQDVQAVVHKTQAAAEQAQVQAKKIAGKARSQWGQVLGQVKRQTKQIRTQINDRAADLADRVQSEKADGTRIPGTTIDVDSEEVWPEESDSPAQPSESP